MNEKKKMLNMLFYSINPPSPAKKKALKVDRSA